MRNVLFLLLKIIVLEREKDVQNSSDATNYTFKSSTMKNSIFLTAILFCCSTFSYGQPGHLDPSFGINGIARTFIGDTSIIGGGRKVLLQPDGSMYTIFNVGDGSAFTAKRLPDGSPDVNYGDHGFSTGLEFAAFDAALGPDGKIVIVGEKYVALGNYAFAVARYNTNGSFDSTF